MERRETGKISITIMNCQNCNKIVLDNIVKCDCGMVFYYIPDSGIKCYCSAMVVMVDGIRYVLEWYIDSNKIRCCVGFTEKEFFLPLYPNWNADKLAKYLMLL